MKIDSTTTIRSKNLIPTYGKPVMLRAFVPGYSVTLMYFNSANEYVTAAAETTGDNKIINVLVPGVAYVAVRLQKNPISTIIPADATTAQIGVSVSRLSGNAGSSNLTAMVAANTGEARTGNIVLKSLAGSTTYNIAVTQVGVSGNISVDTPTLNVDYLTHPVTIDVTSVGAWSVSQRDMWITPSVTTGPNGTTAVTLTIDDNTSNDARTGTITFYNDLTGDIAVVTVNQGGAPTSIGIVPLRVSGPKAGTGDIVPAVAVSGNNWTMSSAPSWVSVTPTSGEAGQTAIGVKYDTPNPGATRTGQLRIKNTVTNEIAICLITQEG